jgi:hypothetical protein
MWGKRGKLKSKVREAVELRRNQSMVRLPVPTEMGKLW